MLEGKIREKRDPVKFDPQVGSPAARITRQVTFWGRHLLLAGCGVLLVFAPLAFGSVHTWAYYPLGLATAGLSILALAWGLFLWYASPTGSMAWPRPPIWGAVLGFGLLVLWQVTPLPQGLAGLISPVALQIRSLGNGYGLADFVPLSLNPYATQLECLKWWPAVVVFYLLLYTVNSRRQIKGLIWLVLGVALFEVVYGFWHLRTRLIWGWKNPYGLTRLCGTFINYNYLANYLVLAILLGFGLLLAQRESIPRMGSVSGRHWLRQWSRAEQLEPLFRSVFLFFWLISLLVALFFTGSRGGMISLLVGLSLMAFLVRGGRWKKGHIVLMGVLLLAGVLYSLYLGTGPYLERLFILSETRGRILASKMAWSQWWEFPWLGSGLGTFDDLAYRYQPAELGATRFMHAHNDWLQLLAETGILGFILVPGTWWLFFRRLIRQWQKHQEVYARGLGLGALAALCAGAFHALGEVPFHVPGLAFTYAALAALTYLTLYNHGPDTFSYPTLKVFRRSWTALGVLLILLGLQGGLAFKSWRWWQAERLAPTEIDSTREPWALAPPNFPQALIDNPTNSRYYLAWAEILEKEKPGDPKTTAEVERLRRSAVFRAPAYWGYRWQLGEFYLRHYQSDPNHHVRQALSELAAAVQLFPESALLHSRLGTLLAWAQRYYPASVPLNLRGFSPYPMPKAIR